MATIVPLHAGGRARDALVAREHDVRFYEGEDFLAGEVARHVGEGLRTGEAALVVARPALLSRVRAALRERGVGTGQLVTLDAQETLDRIAVDGWPDEALFQQVVGARVQQLTQGGRRLRAYGEIVTLLCEQGRHDAAVRLEHMWNALAQLHDFALLCAYPMRLFTSDAPTRAFHHICAAHRRVAPTELSEVPTNPDHGLALARLQQQGLALQQARAERDGLQQELREASRAKDEFLGMLGHELRNPLSPIVTALELMKLRGASGTEREQALIRRQVDHLLRMMDDLLDVSRVTRGKIELRRETVRVADVLGRAADKTAPLIEQCRHALTVELPQSPLLCHADAARLAQVVGHLLSNAARYTRPGGRIVLRAAECEGELEISVADNGAGIAPGMLQPIFELFHQGHRGIDRREGGLGLGLALVKSLVELHGGRVWAESAGLGHGSRFVLRLPALVRAAPVAPPASGEAAANEERLSAAPQTRGKVLVVDDNHEAADFLAELLGAYGYETAVAYDPAQALLRLELFQPQIAILDIGLPVMDGYELAGRIRERMAGCRLFALTGYGLPADRARSKAAGFEAHLVKPVDAQNIAELIRPQAEAGHPA
jgi:signal transduction histidine kinase/CheY-like chemotaxis protein